MKEELGEDINTAKQELTSALEKQDNLIKLMKESLSTVQQSVTSHEEVCVCAWVCVHVCERLYMFLSIPSSNNGQLSAKPRMCI